jgi:hypothetical protein
MSTLAEIEAAIQQLPAQEVIELAQWIEELRSRQCSEMPMDEWLNRARGAALPGTTTADLMNLTRGEE